MIETTEWYPGAIKPVRSGYYERDCSSWGDHVRMYYWDGGKRTWWTIHGLTAGHESWCQDGIPWRGVTFFEHCVLLQDEQNKC